MIMSKTRHRSRWWWRSVSRNNDCHNGDDGVSRSNDDYDDNVSKTKDVANDNFGSKEVDDDNTGSKGDYEDGWCFKLEGFQTITDTPTADWEGARMMGHELGFRRDEARNSRSCERHESMKTEMKETRWNETRILDSCVNDCCWIPWKGPRRLQVFILCVEVHPLEYSGKHSRTL